MVWCPSGVSGRGGVWLCCACWLEAVTLEVEWPVRLTTPNCTQTCPISLHISHITHYSPALSLNTLTVDRAASDRHQPGQTVLASHHICIRHGEINRTFLADTSKLRQRRMMTCPGSIVGRGQSYWDRSSVLTSNDINVLTTTGPSEACRPLDGSQWFKINQRIVLTCKYFKCSFCSVNELLLTSNWI